MAESRNDVARRRGKHSPDSGDLAALGERLRKARETSRLVPKAPPVPPSNLAGSVLGQGMRMAIELVVAVGSGAAVGYGLDHWLGSKPWLLIVFLFLGFGAGIANMLRAARITQMANQPTGSPAEDGKADHTDRSE